MTIDLKKTERRLYTAPGEPEFVDVPPIQYLMIDGTGDPSGDDYREAMETLYPVAYTLRFWIRDRHGLAYVVCPLEGLWWNDDPSVFLSGDKESWKWTSMIRVPPEVTLDLATQAIDHVNDTKHPPAGDKIRLETLEEGHCAQIMHRGPYADEGPTIQRLHEVIAAEGLDLVGKHHEIYLSDPRRTAPERMRTLIRQPAGHAIR
jgi:hypothetical protein